MCSLESKNVVTVTFWVKLTMPALLLKKAIFFCWFFFLCFVLHTLTWVWVWNLYNLVQWLQLVICFYIFISYLLYKKFWDSLYISFLLLCNISTQDIHTSKSRNILSCSFYWSGVWTWFSWILCSRLTGHIQALAQACSDYRHNFFPYGVWLRSPCSCQLLAKNILSS